MKRLLAAFGLLLGLVAPAFAADDMTAAFRLWLEREIRPQARAAGIPRRLFERALMGLSPQLGLPDIVLPGGSLVPERQRQSEFASPARYFAPRSLRLLALRGRRLMRRHGPLLARIERRFGVPGAIVLAIWARESAYGAAGIPHDALRILATQAWLGRRKKKFRTELIAALRILQEGRMSPRELKSSWAGALGQPQMMPTDYLKYAVDFDRDGRRDIWGSTADVLASIANHLKAHGWKRGMGWGFEVLLPATVPCHLEGPDHRRPLSAWLKMGVKPARGRPPRWAARAGLSLLLPAGRYGPAFLVSQNFYVLKAYNFSDLYALFVGHLAERIAGRARGFSAPWKPIGAMARSAIARMQRKLEREGHDVGGADGLPGFRTRRSIGLWQRAHGLRPSCFPTPALLERFR